MLKYIKENWLIAVISGAVGSIITLLLLFIFHIKSWGSDLTANWISAAGSVIGGVGAMGAMYLAYKAYKYATKQYMQNEITKLKFNKIYEVLDEIASGVGYFSKNLLEIKSKCNVLMRIWNQNQYSKDKSIMLTDIPNLERKLVLYLLEKIMQNSDLSAENLKLISLGVDLKLAKDIEANISSYTKYIMDLSTSTTEIADITINELSQVNERAKRYEQLYNEYLNRAEEIALNSKEILDSYQKFHINE